MGTDHFDHLTFHHIWFKANVKTYFTLQNVPLMSLNTDECLWQIGCLAHILKPFLLYISRDKHNQHLSVWS